MVTLLEVRALTHEYDGGLRALDAVDLDLSAGEVVCVLGPNGSGKSTLLRALSGVLTATGGTIALEGRPVSGLGSRERARAIASVPQVLQALPDSDVAGFVLGGRYPYLGWWGKARDGDREAVRRALREADAEEWEHRRLGELSGGQCQRVLVARALAQEARLLLFDEPTAALDPEHQVLLFELFARLVHERTAESSEAGGRGALIATHELALAGRFADRILLLDGGRVVASGAPRDVLREDVLKPVYGPHLHYGSGPAEEGTEARPLIVPWPRPKVRSSTARGS